MSAAVHPEKVEIKTWCKLWSLKNPTIRISMSKSTHPGKAAKRVVHT